MPLNYAMEPATDRSYNWGYVAVTAKTHITVGISALEFRCQKNETSPLHLTIDRSLPMLRCLPGKIKCRPLTLILHTIFAMVPTVDRSDIELHFRHSITQMPL